MKKIGALLAIALTVNSVIAKDVRIGLFYSSNPSLISVQYNVGRYTFFSETAVFKTLSNKSDKIIFKASGEKVKAYLNGDKIGENTWFRLDRNTDLNSLKISDGKINSTFEGSLIVYSINGNLKVVNEVTIDKYVEGVIKGEAGYGYELEYYKVQAVISRTYALHDQKHKSEGFDLCDHIHCQVYKGVNTNKKIAEAVRFTSEEVIVDSSINYINTLFHSNCGGQTVTSDIVWSKKLSCMESVKDTFCINSLQANWRKTISKSSWVQFLSNKTGKSTTYFNSKELNFNQYSRKEFYELGSLKIRLVDIRSHFNLKSTFFSVLDVGDKIILIGKGYGHGVGLCQEGGIVMSKTYNYKEIIHFYYQDISIMTINKVEYYRLF
jgi:stage II sporulation protein D